jgi:hypothetical protein
LSEVTQVPGVLGVEQARVRRAGANYFADLTLALPRRYTFEHTGELVRSATEAVHRTLPEADVVIHTVPRQARAESIFDRVRAVAARNNVSVHELSVQSHRGGCAWSSTWNWTRRCRCLRRTTLSAPWRRRFCARTPEIDGVLTHIESEPATIEQPEERVEADRRSSRRCTGWRAVTGHYRCA